MTIVSENHFTDVRIALSVLDTREIDAIVNRIMDTGIILTCGNGGSAATAIHFASDLRSLGYTAWDLHSPSKMTQIDNDAGHGYIFSHQVIPGALVIAFSGSGTSTNIKRLAYQACESLVLITSDMLKDDYPGVQILRVASIDYEVVEDVHLAICHAIKKELKRRKEAS